MSKYRSYRYKKAYRVKRKKNPLKKKFLWQGILSVLVLGGLFYFFFFSQFFQIKEVRLSGEQKVPREEVMEKIQNNLSRHFLFFGTRSIFLADVSRIREELLLEFPQMAGIAFDRDLPGTLNAAVTEREGRALWCQEQCFLMDGEGVIFEEVYGDSPLMVIRSASAPSETGLGIKVMEGELLSLILGIEKKLGEKTGLSLVRAEVVSETRINFRTEEGWEIYFNTQEDADWQITKLGLVLEKEISPERRDSLEYVDLRFTRVYYK